MKGDLTNKGIIFDTSLTIPSDRPENYTYSEVFEKVNVYALYQLLMKNYTFVLQIEQGLFKVIGVNTYPQLAYEILCEVH